MPVALPTAGLLTKIPSLMRTVGSKKLKQGMIEKGKEYVQIRTKALTKPQMAPEKMCKSYRK